MKKANEMQAVIVAGQLRALGVTDAEAAPLAAWLQLGFLQRPTVGLIRLIDKWLKQADA